MHAQSLPLFDPDQFTDWDLPNQLAAVRPIAERKLLEDGIEAPSIKDVFAVFAAGDRWRAIPDDEWILVCACFDACYALGFTVGQLVAGFKTGGTQ